MVDVLFLSNNDNSMALFNWLISKCNVKHYADKINCEILKLIEPKLVISYGYRNIIPVECINYMKSRIINLHISYLPWNRGADPNIWSILDGTPKGVTIHKIAQGLDSGDIIYQKQVEFDYEKETLKSSYNKLHKEIVDLFKLHWDEIFNNTYTTQKQNIDSGTYHTTKELNLIKSQINFSYDDNINTFIKKVNIMKEFNYDFKNH